MPNLGFTICLTTTYIFPLGVVVPMVIFIFAPPGQCFSKCWSEPGTYGATSGKLEGWFYS